jgi:hypothetical protein
MLLGTVMQFETHQQTMGFDTATSGVSKPVRQRVLELHRQWKEMRRIVPIAVRIRSARPHTVRTLPAAVLGAQRPAPAAILAASRHSPA